MAVSASVTGGIGGDADPTGSGGGGGGAGVVMQTANGLTVNAIVTGGNGANVAAGGGGGGAGVVLQQGGALQVNANIVGGNGGGGGAGKGGDGGSGIVANAAAQVTIAAGSTVAGGSAVANSLGSGGAGLNLSAGGTLINAGTISGGSGGGSVSGGPIGVDGGSGSGGARGFTSGTTRSGDAGVGITGAGLTVINSGTIAGSNVGASGQANAITFTGGNNVLELQAGSAITGNVSGTGNDTFRLGGATDSSFAVSGIGTQYAGFNSFVKTGTSTWTLTGTTGAVTPWTINQGTLAISADNNLGAGSGGLTFNGGTLRFGASFDLASTRTITVNAGGATFDVGGNLTTFFQGFAGTGPITFTNGSIVLAAPNTYSGATTVTGTGILTVFNPAALSPHSDFTVNGFLGLNGFSNTIQSLSGSGTVQNGAATAATLTIAPPSGITTFSGTLKDGGSGPLSLVLSGGGTQILSGNNTYTGPTTINAGTLLVNGSTSSSATSVNANGVLLGTGKLGATQVNAGGTLAPGDGTPATSMTLASLALQSGAQYLVQVNPATSSFANVTGNASLGGATVHANFASGIYVEKRYMILGAGSVTGNFDPTVVSSNLPSGFQTSLSYDPTHAYLDLSLVFLPPPGSGLSSNQQSVGNAIISFFNGNGSIPIVFGGLTPNGLTQLSGEVGSATQQTTFSAMNEFLGVMTDPFIAGRGDPLSAGGTPNAFADQSMAYAAKSAGQSKRERDAYAAVYTKAQPLTASFEQRWSVWAAGFGGSQKTDGSAVVGSNSTSSNLGGTAVGADYRVSRDTLVGFALAGGGANFTVSNNLGGGRSDLFQAGAFFRHNVGPAYITGALAYGWQDIVTDRTITVAGVDRLRAEFNANAYSGRLEGGYRFATGGFGLTPYAAAQFTTFDLPAYAEQAIVGSNIFALAYNAKGVTDTRTELGLRTDKSFAQSDGVVTLRGRVAWARDFNPDRAISATFQTLPGASFVVNGAAMAADSALVSATAEKKWLGGWSAAATFAGEFSSVTRSYAGKGVVRYAW
ncbi:MAG: autotransporter domain-containing protein [Bradyrhizobium sp.]|nr:autotransporter domain-containing protein [Bradyrhizobium sp.]